MRKHLLVSTLAVGIAMTVVAENRPVTFFEGFEGRGTDGFVQNTDTYSNNYLPEGWTEISKANPAHQSYPDLGEDPWDYTWVTVPSNAVSGPANSGNCHAYIRNVIGYDPAEQDEWLITPSISVQNDDILFFYVAYCPWFTLRPDSQTHEPTGKYNYLEVLISEDDGQTWSEPMWNSYDDAKSLSWDEIYNSSMSGEWLANYRGVFIDLDKYYGKDVKVAFRYRGRLGQSVSIDDVTVGVPTPTAGYTLPEGYLMPAVTSSFSVSPSPLAFSAHGVADTWTNISTVCKTYDWTYNDVTGAEQKAETRDLVTPSYPEGAQVSFPVLDAMYGENHSGEWSLVNHKSSFAGQIGLTEPKIQYGGTVAGTLTDVDGTDGLIGVGNYDLYDEGLQAISHNAMIAISGEAEQRWDAYFTNGSVRDWDFLQAIGSVYPKPTAPYGISYVYANVLLENIGKESNLTATICRWETEVVADIERSYVGDPIASAPMTWDPAAVGSGVPTNIVFDFSKNPVTVDFPYVILISGYSRDYNEYDEIAIADNIRFYYASSVTPQTDVKSIMLFKDYNSQLEGGWYNAYVDLSQLASSSTNPDRHPAGLLIGLGVATSTMELVGEDHLFECPAEGGEKTFTLKTSANPDHLTLVDGETPCDWATLTATPNGENVDVTVKVSANTENRRRNKTLRVAAPGSYVEIEVRQDRNSSIETIGADNSADAPAEYFTLQGVRVVEPVAGGLYIRRQGSKAEKVIIR